MYLNWVDTSTAMGGWTSAACPSLSFCFSLSLRDPKEKVTNLNWYTELNEQKIEPEMETL